MARSLAGYGLDQDGIVLEDPALFDSLVVRMLEDLELAAQVMGRREGADVVEPNIMATTLAALGLQMQGVGKDLPELLWVGVQQFCRDYWRGPLGYTEGTIEQAGEVVAAAMYEFLTTGADAARQEGSQVVKLRHVLPACEKWPYPLNRFC